MNDPANAAAGLLEKLRDVQAPESSPWWPPAPGWWILALLAIAGIVVLSLWFWRQFEKREGKREALRILSEHYAAWQSGQAESRDPIFAQAAMKLLRRVGIHFLGRKEVARLTGTALIDRINPLSDSPISPRVGETLTALVYLPPQGSSERSPAASDDSSQGGSGGRLGADDLHREIEAWLHGLGVPEDA